MVVRKDSGRTAAEERQTIRQVQAELNRLGCNAGTPDGVMGPRSRAALKSFAEAAQIPFQISDFRSKLFLRRIVKVSEPLCS
ncbi:peptidoglycan-binding domain-containing protein [Roseovarius sp.]|uniref:peptidoglycan-binding domain-containing protein n=1 Tax=Roseovarius sp. TaxID=1486281 RepID=UPI003D11DC06